MPNLKINRHNFKRFPQGTQCEFYSGKDRDGEMMIEPALVIGWGYTDDGRPCLEVDTEHDQTYKVLEFVTLGTGFYLTQYVNGV